VRPPYRVGLTGGIGAGKTAVCDCFQRLGVPVIDADIIARELVAPGRPALTAISQHFGKEVIASDGQLDRPALRELVFTDATAKQALESILHPLIQQGMLAELGGIKTPYCILCIPLLLETGQEDLVDRILVVDTPVELQLERVMQRDHCSAKQARGIIGSQLERQQRLRQTDDIIDNSESLDALCGQVQMLHEKYLSLAQN